jgi:ferredoxin
MYKVTLKPSNQVVEIEGDKNLLEALKEKGIYIKSSCGGVASCSDCICKVVGGEDNLNPPPFAEIKFLGNVFHITKERLACQTTIHGDITLDISRHDQESDQEKLKAKTTNLYLKTKVRKKDEVIQKKNEKIKSKMEKIEKDREYIRHWEGEKKEKWEKKLGGSKKPKLFSTENIEEYKGPFGARKDFKKERKKEED